MMKQDDFFERIFAGSDPAASADRAEPGAPARLKSQTFSRMALLQAETGPLASVSESKAAGRGLCVFEELARIVPSTERFKHRNYCRACHARKLAEVMEHAPIYWGHCPYVEFQK